MSRQQVDTTENRIDRKTAAQILSISQRTLDRYIRQKRVYSRKVNRRVWLDKEDVKRFKKKLEQELVDDVNSQNRPHRDIKNDQNDGIITSRQSRQDVSRQVSSVSTQDTVEDVQNEVTHDLVEKVLHNDKNEESVIINSINDMLREARGEEISVQPYNTTADVSHVSSHMSIPGQHMIQGSPFSMQNQSFAHSLVNNLNSENIYKKLYEELKTQHEMNQKRIEAANYRVGQLEAKIDTMIPELEFKRQQTKFRELETGLKIQVKKRELQLKKARKMLNSEKMNKWVFAITALALICMQPIIWLMQN